MTVRIRRIVRWLFDRCVLAYPPAFRDASGSALSQTAADRMESLSGGPIRIATNVLAECANILYTGLRMRWTDPPGRPVRALRQSRPQRWSNHGQFVLSIVQDSRYAARVLTKQPAFTVSAVALLALGIGINTAAFSIVNAYLLRPLPFPQADRLVRVSIVDPAADANAMNTIPRGIHRVQWPSQDDVIEHLIAWDLDGFSLVGTDQPESVDGAWVTPGYFAAVDVTPHLGRGLVQADGEAGAAPVAVISYALWMRRFGGDSTVIDRAVRAYSTDRPFEAEVFTIVGVLPADFWFLHRFTDFMPALTVNRHPSLIRLQPGITIERARAHFTALVASQADLVDPSWTMFVQPAHESYVREVRPIVIALAAAVGLVLLIACGNVAMLLMTRALGREREFGIRTAMEASRARIVQQLLIEGGALAVMAGILGVILAHVGLIPITTGLERQLGTSVPGGASGVSVSGIGLAVALVLTALTGLAFGTIPAVAMRRGEETGNLGEVRATAPDSVRRQWLRHVLIAGEVAVSLALLISAGLMVRTVMHLNQLELGFDSENVLKANVSLRLRSYPDDAARIAFADRLVEEVAALPGVVAASITDVYPFRRPIGSRIQSQPTEPAEEGPRAVPHAVTPGYFETMAIRITRGRPFDERDEPGAAPVAIVSETLAQQLWPGIDPIGQVVRDVGMGTGYDPDLPWRTVVGVVGDIRKTLTEQNYPDLYVPYRQDPRAFMFVMARIVGSPQTVARALEQAVWVLDPEQPVAEVETMREVVLRQGTHPRFLAGVLSAFSVLGAGLALYGLYSVVSYAVTQRSRDIAIRIALGAGHRAVTRQLVVGAGAIVGVGILLGFAASAGLTRLLGSQMHGVENVDAVIYSSLGGLLFLAGVFSSWIPARRAARSDPMRLLREE